jgi:hypothetical protein
MCLVFPPNDNFEKTVKDDVLMIKTLSSKVVYKNKWMTVREDIVERASGAEGLFGYVDKPHFAAIIALKDDQIQLVH